MIPVKSQSSNFSIVVGECFQRDSHPIILHLVIYIMSIKLEIGGTYNGKRKRTYMKHNIRSYIASIISCVSVAWIQGDP